MTDETSLAIERELQLLAFVNAQVRRISSLPTTEQPEATARLERHVRRELSR